MSANTITMRMAVWYYGIQTIDGVTYGFDEVTGVKIYGEKYIEGAWRYFEEDAGVDGDRLDKTSWP